MTIDQKNEYTAKFKAKVVLEVLKEKRSLDDIADEYGLSHDELRKWEKYFLENASFVFEKNTEGKEHKKKTEIPKKEKPSIAKKLAIVVGIGISVGICVWTGCFIEKQVEPSSPVAEKTEQHDYATLVNQWNSAVLAADLNRSFELPRGDNLEVVKKLDSLFEQTMTPESFKKQNECVLRGNRKIYTPSLEYINFLKENGLQHEVHFTGKDSQDKIIQELKKITSSEYIDYKMLEKVAYLKSFKLFFEKNKKKFYKDGFSEHIKDFDTYQIAVGRCE